MKLFRSGPESFVLDNRKQVFEVSKLSPVVHTKSSS
jgi:hypothetical protein